MRQQIVRGLAYLDCESVFGFKGELNQMNFSAYYSTCGLFSESMTNHSCKNNV